MPPGSTASRAVLAPEHAPGSASPPLSPEPALARVLLGRPGVLWLSIAVFVARLPGFHGAILNIDEADHVVIARMMRAGALPYVGVVETKPPLTYLAFWLASFAGKSVLPARVLAALFLLGTVLLVRAAVQRWTGDRRAATAAGWCTLLATLFEPPWAATEIFMNQAVAAALWLCVRAERERKLHLDLAIGVALGLASLFKQQAGILGPALVLGCAVGCAVGTGSRAGLGRVAARIALLAAGAALPWAATVAIYAWLGHARELVEWVISRNFGYVAASNAGVWSHAGAFGLGVGLLLLPWSLATREALRRRGDALGLSFGIALALTWLAVGAGGRYYVHYFLQFAPILGVLAGPALARLAGEWRTLPAVRRIAAAASLALPVAGSAAYGVTRAVMHDYPFQDAKANRVAECIRRATAPTDRVFVWGHFSPLYYRSDRLPGTRYLMTSVQMGNFDPGELPPDFDPAAHRSDRDVRAAISDLERLRPALVVDTAPADIHHWGRIPLDAFHDLRDEVAHDYRPIGACAGALLYRRATPPPAVSSRASPAPRSP